MKVLKWIFSNFAEIVAGIGLSVMMIITAFNVLSRYIFSFAFGGVEEITLMGSAWCIFVGAAAAYKRRMHYGVDILLSMLPESWKKRANFIIDLLLFICLGYITYLSYVFAMNAWVKPTPYLSIPYFYIDISAALGFGLMTIQTVLFLIRDAKDMRKYEVQAKSREAQSWAP